MREEAAGEQQHGGSSSTHPSSSLHQPSTSSGRRTLLLHVAAGQLDVQAAAQGAPALQRLVEAAALLALHALRAGKTAG